MALEANILIYTKSAFIYNRIENAFLHNNNIHLIGSTSISDCLYKIQNKGAYLSCIIINDEYEEKGALINLSSINKAAKNRIPIILISSAGKKITFFSKAIEQGVKDIIVMPFTDSFLRERIFKIVNKNEIKNVEIISLRLFKYLNGELRKAKKGSYPLAIMLTTLQFENEEKYSKKQRNFYLNIFSDNLKGLYWETDLFIRFDSKYYLGVFPFCDSKNKQIILNKNTDSFNELVRTNIIPSDCKMVTSFVSYPDNMDSIANGFRTLLKNIKDDFSDSDLEIFFDEYGEIKYDDSKAK